MVCLTVLEIDFFSPSVGFLDSQSFVHCGSGAAKSCIKPCVFSMDWICFALLQPFASTYPYCLSMALSCTGQAGKMNQIIFSSNLS